MDTGALNNNSLENIRETARLLGTVLANSGIAFGSDTNKMRFSDLPAPLKALIEDMVERVEKKIGQKDSDEVTQKLRTYKAGGD